MDTRNFKKIAPFSNDFYWNLAAHSGPANHSTSFIRPVIASGDVAKTIYGNSDCYQLHSGSTDTRNFKKNCAFFRRIPDYWNLAAHSGPPNHSTSFIRPVIAVRDVAETIHGNSDCYQLPSGNKHTRNFEKLRLFPSNFTGIWRPTADPQTIPRPLKDL